MWQFSPINMCIRDTRTDMMEWWHSRVMRTVYIREIMKSYRNIDFTSFLLFSLSCTYPFTSAICLFDKPLSPSSVRPTIPFFLFLLSSDSVAHPFPITLGCCLGPQHDLLYITTLLRLFSLRALHPCVVCVYVCACM